MSDELNLWNIAVIVALWLLFVGAKVSGVFGLADWQWVALAAVTAVSAGAIMHAIDRMRGEAPAEPGGLA